MRVERSFKLLRSAVHIWTLHIRASGDIAAEFERVLATDEKDRAAQFRFSHLRQSFVMAHGAIRYLLGRYLDLHPASIRFIYGLKGKPALASTACIQFNMAHSGSLAAVALTTACQVGIDLEQIRPILDMQHIANCFFCPEEAAELISLPPSERERAFFRCWTCKEAYLKAIGDGFSAPLDSFRVTIQPNTPARFVHLGNDTIAADAWSLHDLSVASDYAAALAYRDGLRPVSVFPMVDIEQLLGE